MTPPSSTSPAWMTWLTSSTWTMAPPPGCAPLQPCLSFTPALRSIQARSGIFDPSVTGDDLFSVAPAEKSLLTEEVAPLSPMFADANQTLEEVLAILEGAAPMPPVDMALLSAAPTDGAVTPPPVSDELLGGAGAMHFLEDFTNLNDYLFTGTVDAPMDTTTTITTSTATTSATMTLASIAEDAETSVAMVSSTEGTKRKRTATQAFTDCVSLAAVNPDHCDYVSKKPRQAGSIAATKVATDVSVNKDSRYRERRTKNNIASKRSRETRKQKFHAMEAREIELEASNAELEKKIEEMQELATKMKDILVKRLSHGSPSQ